MIPTEIYLFGAHHPHLVTIHCWSFSREHSSSSAHECSSLSTVPTYHIILIISNPDISVP